MPTHTPRNGRPDAAYVAQRLDQPERAQLAHAVLRRADARQDQRLGVLDVARVAGDARPLADGFERALHAAQVARVEVDDDRSQAAASARPTLQAR